MGAGRGTGNSCFNEPDVLEKYKHRNNDIPSSFEVSKINSLGNSSEKVKEKDDDSMSEDKFKDLKLNQIIKKKDSNTKSNNPSLTKTTSTKTGSNENNDLIVNHLDRQFNLKSNLSPDKKLISPTKVQITNNKNSSTNSGSDKNILLQSDSDNKEEELKLVPKQSQYKKSRLDEGKNEFVRGPKIGSGYYGNVYSGLSKISGGIVAIKAIRIKGEDKEFIQEVKKQIKNVVQKLSELKHKNILIIKGFQEYSKDIQEVEFVYEYTNAGSIKQVLMKFGTFEEKLIKFYVKQILDALVYLHEKNIIHRKIKNTNILIDDNGTVKLTDFIISNLSENNDDFENKFIETYIDESELPYWVAPEIALKSGYITSAVDIWSLGCIIIEMANKTPPWSNVAKTKEEVYNILKTTKVPPKFPSHLSKEAKEFLFLCLNRDPRKRSTAKELLEHRFLKTEVEEKHPIKKRFSGLKHEHLSEENLKMNTLLKNKKIILKADDPINDKDKAKTVKSKTTPIPNSNNKDQVKVDYEKQKTEKINLLGSIGDGEFTVSMSVSQSAINNNYNSIKSVTTQINPGNRIIPEDLFIQEVTEDNENNESYEDHRQIIKSQKSPNKKLKHACINNNIVYINNSSSNSNTLNLNSDDTSNENLKKNLDILNEDDYDEITQKKKDTRQIRQEIKSKYIIS